MITITQKKWKTPQAGDASSSHSWGRNLFAHIWLLLTSSKPQVSTLLEHTVHGGKGMGQQNKPETRLMECEQLLLITNYKNKVFGYKLSECGSTIDGTLRKKSSWQWFTLKSLTTVTDSVKSLNISSCNPIMSVWLYQCMFILTIWDWGLWKQTSTRKKIALWNDDISK